MSIRASLPLFLALCLLMPAMHARAQTTCDGREVTIEGTAGDDDIDGTEGDDVISAGDGDDSVAGLEGNDTVCGGDGNDRISGGAGNDSLHGDAGNDSVEGYEGDDSVFGGAGNDRLGDQLADGSCISFHDGGSDTFDGGPDDDFVCLLGADPADGGEGIDEIRGAGGTLDLSTNSYTIGDERSDISRFENASLAQSGLLVGDDNDNALELFGGTARGGGGDDVITARFLKETMIGGLGNDRLLSEGGKDRLRGGGGSDFLHSGRGDDSVGGGSGGDEIHGGDDDDDLNGGGGRDAVAGGEGRDVCRSAENATGCERRDR